MRSARLLPWSLVLCVTQGLGCALFFPARVPMAAVRSPDPAGGARCLVVLFPGRGDGAEDFVKKGFFEAFRARHLSVDLVAADATLGYYLSDTLVDRLTADVFEPQLPAHYDQVWEVGNSMGGLGTFLYALKGSQRITGILALAPYLGDRSLQKDIAAAGGLGQWVAPPKAAHIDRDNYQPQLWRWLQAVATGREHGPELYFGVGQDDGLARGVGLVAALLPKDHAFTAPGGHDWPVWRVLLERFLDTSDLARGCAAPR